MKLSFMALNRMIEERAARDAAYRRAFKDKNNVTLSEGRALPDAALVEKLRSFGLEVDRAWLGDALQRFPSAQDLSESVRKPDVPTNEHDNWLWIGLTCLWERWFPDKPNFEMIDDGMQAGYQRLAEGSSVAAARDWLKVWRGVLHLMQRFNYRTIDEVDEQFGGTNSVHNWMSDFTCELRNAGLTDPAFNSDRLPACQAALELAERSADLGLAKNLLRDLAEAHADLGDYETMNRLYAGWLNDDPRWGWGWIGWSDAFFLFAPADRKDAARAEEILTRGLAVPDVTELDVIVDRLVSIYTDTGRSAEAIALMDRHADLLGSRRQTRELPCTDETDLDTIIAVLDRPYTGVLPESALRQAQRRREEITPLLIDMVRNATAEVRAGRDVPGDGALFALFLLAEFKCREALPVILEALTLPDDGPFDLFGDAIFGELSGILAALVDSPQAIDELLANRSVDSSVRISAADAYLYLVRDGRLSRDEAVERLRATLRRMLSEADDDGITAVVLALGDYSPREALDEINAAFRRDLVDPTFVDSDDIIDSIAKGDCHYQEALENCPPTGIEDTVEELRDWESYQDDALRGDDDLTEDEFDEDDLEDEDFDVDGLGDEDDLYFSPTNEFAQRLPAEPPATIRNTEPRVGRNDPCPCGSGRKFKKCCGAN